MALAAALIPLAALFLPASCLLNSLQSASLECAEVFFQTFFFVKNWFFPYTPGAQGCLPQLCSSFPGKPGKSTPWLRDAQKVRGESSFVISCLPLPCTRDVTGGAAVW